VVRKVPFAQVLRASYQEHDIYPLALCRRGSVVPHRYFRVSEGFSAHVQTFAAEAAVVFEPEVVEPPSWAECAADCAEKDRHLYLHRHLYQEKGIGDDVEESHHHRPIPEEWVVPLSFYVGFHRQ